MNAANLIERIGIHLHRYSCTRPDGAIEITLGNADSLVSLLVEAQAALIELTGPAIDPDDGHGGPADD